MLINKYKLAALLNNTNGKFVSVEFVKKDGTLRKMNGRFGVTKHLKGGVNKTVKESNSYMTIYDTKAEGYRTINLETVKRVKFGGEVFEVVQ
jgi:hypothetical protein